MQKIELNLTKKNHIEMSDVLKSKLKSKIDYLLKKNSVSMEKVAKKNGRLFKRMRLRLEVSEYPFAMRKVAAPILTVLNTES